MWPRTLCVPPATYGVFVWLLLLLQRAQRDVLSLDTEGLYRPKTRETRAAYETLLNQIQAQFGDQPQVRGTMTLFSASLTRSRNRATLRAPAQTRVNCRCLWSKLHSPGPRITPAGHSPRRRRRGACRPQGRQEDGP